MSSLPEKMSSLPGKRDSGKVSGQKMNFSRTCNLLSQYVKEKRSLSISNPGVDGFNNNNNNKEESNKAATMNLFPVNGKSFAQDSNGGCVGRTISLFPQSSGFNSSFFNERPLMANSCASKRVSTEPPTAPMTIFFRGQVLVFNDMPCDKAKEVLDMASSFESSQKRRKLETTNLAPALITNPNLNQNPIPNPSQSMNVALNFGQGVIPANVPRSPVANVFDLPIARKASLHRFLEKRKDRLVGKAPLSFDVTNGVPSKPVEGKSWLGLASMPVFQAQQQP